MLKKTRNIKLHTPHLILKAQEDAPLDMSRRTLLIKTALVSASAGLALTALPQSAQASLGSFCPPSMNTGGAGMPDGSGSGVESDYTGAIPGEGPPTRSIKFMNPRNGETFSENYVVDGQFVPAALEKYNWFARDWRHNDPTSMDPKLLDIIYDLTVMLGVTSAWQLNSGYRNPASNATVGGAKQSQHLRGKANDITNPQKPPSAIQAAARALKKGGVGTYNTFTHIDTAGVRYWNG
jgi:uncharacterized protein YcbK (DUF882 family)